MKPSLTINGHTPGQNISDPHATQKELSQRASEAAYRLVAMAQAAASNEDDNKFSYGRAWIAYANNTGYCPEM